MNVKTGSHVCHIYIHIQFTSQATKVDFENTWYRRSLLKVISGILLFIL